MQISYFSFCKILHIYISINLGYLNCVLNCCTKIRSLSPMIYSLKIDKQSQKKKTFPLTTVQTLSLVTVHIFRVLSARGKHESSVSKTGRTRDRLEDPFQRSSIDRQFSLRDISLCTDRAANSRGNLVSSADPSFHPLPSTSSQRSGPRVLYRRAILSPCATWKRGDEEEGTNVFPCLFIVLCSNDREENEKSGIPDYPARNKASFRNEQGSEKLEIRASHAGGKEEGRKEEGKIKEEGSGREFCRRFEKLPTIPRSRDVERNQPATGRLHEGNTSSRPVCARVCVYAWTTCIRVTNEERESGWESLVRGKSNGWFACRSTVLRRLKSPFPWISFHPQLALHFLLLNSLSRGTRVFASWETLLILGTPGVLQVSGRGIGELCVFLFFSFFFEREKKEEV